MEENKRRQEKKVKNKKYRRRRRRRRRREKHKMKEIRLKHLSSPLLHCSVKHLLAKYEMCVWFGSERVNKFATQRKVNMVQIDVRR
jgi:hypothetical protein